MNEENLIPQAHVLTVEEQSRGGKRSGEARREKKSAQELAKMIDGLGISEKNNEALDAYGVPQDDRSLLTVKLIALHQKAVKGDVQAIRLWLELVGEDPSQSDIQERVDEITQQKQESRISDASEVLTFFSEMMRDKKVQDKDRLRAAENLAKRMGLDKEKGEAEEQEAFSIKLTIEDLSK